MNQLVSILGFAVAIAGACLAAAPMAGLGLGRSVVSPNVMYVAGALRVAFGALLVYVASKSRTPVLMRAIGGIFIVAGLGALFLTVDQARTIFDWLIAQGPWFTRAWASAVAALGICVVFATTQRNKFLT